MTNGMLASIALWTGMAAVTIGLAIYRKAISKNEMDIVHIRDDESSLISGQEQLSHQLDRIDYWGKVLTVVMVIFGVVLGGIYLYNAWVASSNLAG